MYGDNQKGDFVRCSAPLMQNELPLKHARKTRHPLTSTRLVDGTMAQV